MIYTIITQIINNIPEIIVFCATLFFIRIGIINILFYLAKKKENKEEYEKALFYYKYIILLKPNNLYDIYNSIASCFSELGEYTSAIIYYQKAIKLEPDLYFAYKNLGLTYLDSGDTQKAHEFFSKSLRKKHGFFYNENPHYLDNYVCSENMDLITGVHKLKHDIEYFDYLLTKELLPTKFKKNLEDMKILKNYLESNHNKTFLIKLSSEYRKYLQEIYERNIYIHECKYIEEPINNNLDLDFINNEYKKNEFVYFDNFLSEEALNEIRFYCLNSSIFHEYKRVWGYLASNMDNGLSCTLLYKIADEMKAKLPEIFKNYKLMNMWAFKCDSERQGVAIHADEAYVNINFWIAQESANLDKNSGGLIVYNVPAPDNWTFEQYNGNDKLIYDYLKEKKAKKVVIPHKENRCIIFNSALFHETDKFNFKNGYENRRINVTLLFGRRKVSK